MLDSQIRFAGIIDSSGYLFAGGAREGLGGHLGGRATELSLTQSAFVVRIKDMFSSELGNLRHVVYVHDKVKLFSIPIKEYILIFSAENTINEVSMLKKISDYIKSVESQLTLYPPLHLIDEDKKETLKNLYECGVEDEAIADQLDLDVNMVRNLLKQE